MNPKTTSGINYLGDVTVLGTITTTDEVVSNNLTVANDATVDNNATVNNNLQVNGTASLNTLILNAQVFRFRHGTFTPNLGYITDDTYGSGFTNFGGSPSSGPWNSNAVMNRAFGYYTQIGVEVYTYIDLDWNSQGVTYLSGGGANVTIMGINNIPVKICAVAPGEDIVEDQEMIQVDFPNGFAGTQPQPYAPCYPAPYSMACYPAGSVEQVPNGYPGSSTITHTFTGYEIIIYAPTQVYIPILTDPTQWELQFEGYGPLTNVNFTIAGTNYHVKFKGEAYYYNNE
jgi:hypothetical protein